MFFKKKKGKTPKTSNRKVVPNMKPIEELRTNKDVAEWCRDFLRITVSFRQNSRLPTVRSATISWHSSGFSWNGARAKTSLWKA